MAIESLAALESACEQRDMFEVVRESDCVERGVTPEESYERMCEMFAAMQHSAAGYCASLRSASGMVGGDGEKMRAYVEQGRTICGPYIGQVISQALEMGENNACMKCIVAAPTAGSCGVMPAVLLPYQQREKLDDDAIVRALYVVGAIGQVIATKASIAGAAGGCQYEIGTASAMAAAALTHVLGGSATQCAHAFALAMSNLLGLVCDPVAGLVELPCVRRNVIGAVGAVSAANMALAGIESRIPPDEVIDAMGEIGDALPAGLRETGLGGLAATPTARKLAEDIGKGQ